jgi:hypothetical protein
LLVTATVPSPPILVTLMMEALRSFQTLVLTRATQHSIPKDSILRSHRLENLKSSTLAVSSNWNEEGFLQWMKVTVGFLRGTQLHGM